MFLDILAIAILSTLVGSILGGAGYGLVKFGGWKLAVGYFTLLAVCIWAAYHVGTIF